jgi:hypothetical protein
MKRLTGLLLACGLLFGGLSTVAAQQMSDGAMPPPKVLQVIREFLKPGKSGSPHEATESDFVKAFQAAKWPTHYLAVDSMTGSPRSLFFVAYDSFAAWEKDAMATQHDAALSAALDRAAIADGALLESSESSVYVYREDYSLRAPVNIPLMRYFEIQRFKIRPGHEKEWDTLVKMYVSGYEKTVPNAHWTTYQSAYGADNGGVYIVVTPMKSAVEVDQNFADSKTFMGAMGEDWMKKAGDLAAACIESSQDNLFLFNPKLSYVSDDWIKADPSFWKPAK